jgi:hypothetical protein
MSKEKDGIVILQARLLPNGQMNIQTAGDGVIPHDFWGEIIATIIRHIGNAEERHGNPVSLTIAQVLKHMDGELDNPTAKPSEGPAS